MSRLGSCKLLKGFLMLDFVKSFRVVLKKYRNVGFYACGHQKHWKSKNYISCSLNCNNAKLNLWNFWSHDLWPLKQPEEESTPELIFTELFLVINLSALGCSGTFTNENNINVLQPTCITSWTRHGMSLFQIWCL